MDKKNRKEEFKRIETFLSVSYLKEKEKYTETSKKLDEIFESTEQQRSILKKQLKTTINLKKATEQNLKELKSLKKTNTKKIKVILKDLNKEYEKIKTGLAKNIEKNDELILVLKNEKKVLLEVQNNFSQVDDFLVTFRKFFRLLKQVFKDMKENNEIGKDYVKKINKLRKEMKKSIKSVKKIQFYEQSDNLKLCIKFYSETMEILNQHHDITKYLVKVKELLQFFIHIHIQKKKIEKLEKFIIGYVKISKSSKKYQDYLSCYQQIGLLYELINSSYKKYSLFDFVIPIWSKNDSFSFSYSLFIKEYNEIKNFSKQHLELSIELLKNSDYLDELKKAVFCNEIGSNYLDTQKKIRNIREIFKKLDGHFICFKKKIVEILHDFEVVECGFRVLFEHKSTLEELRFYLREKDELNAIVKRQFKNEQYFISEDSENLEKVVKIIQQKSEKLNIEFNKINFDIPIKMEIQRLSNFNYFGKIYSKRKLFQKSKKRLLYFGELKLSYNITPQLFSRQRTGVGKEFKDGKVIYYGKFTNNKRHGSGSLISEGQSIHGEFRNGKLLRRNLDSIKIREFNVEKIFKKINYQKSILGSGAFGEVFKIRIDQTVYAVKVIKQHAEYGFEDFMRECKLLASLNHPNIINFVGMSKKPSGFISDYCPYGSVSKKIARKELSFNQKLKIIYQTVQGMNYLHLVHIIHRDMKWDNVLIYRKNPMMIKIIDFGLSKSVQSYRLSEKHTRNVGTGYYIAPFVLFFYLNFRECFLLRDYNHKCDVYSFAICLYEILFDTINPWKSYRKRNNIISVDVLILKAARDPNFRPLIEDELVNEKNAKLVESMKKCWSHDPTKRPSFDDLEKEIKALIEIYIPSYIKKKVEDESEDSSSSEENINVINQKVKSRLLEFDI